MSAFIPDATPPYLPKGITIVVPACNAEASIRACIEALLRQELPDTPEIIVVDDGSTDSTSSIISEYAPRVTLIRQPRSGAAAARNAGIRVASGGVILFTDADCAPVASWASALVSAIEHGADGAKGTYRTRQQPITARFVQAEYESKYRRMARHSRIDFVDTYSAAYRRDALLSVGGFDEQISAVEDQELSFRLAERGYDLRFVPEAVVYHTHAPNPVAYLRKKFRIGYWKVQVTALHPGRIASDSHTPQSIKAQMALLGVGLLCTLFSPLSTLARKLSVACALTFLATSAPLTARIARQDLQLALATPLMILLRAVGLSCGTLAGSVRFGSHLVRRAGYAGLKRGLDVVLSSIGLVAAAPFMALIALAIRLESRGPAIFVQWRAGRDGKPFRIFKFRTMVDGAEGMHTKIVQARGLHEPVLKFDNDPRVTRVGRFLRRWSLDELPQLGNVLRGEMSLVGPRPEELRIVKMYSPWHRQRLGATPGITGPMQVNGRADLSLDERVRIELDYINHATIIYDMTILARTLKAVLSGRGSY